VWDGRQLARASQEAEERPILEDFTKQRIEDRDWEHYSLCDSDLLSVVTSCVFKRPMNTITNPNPVYSHTLSRDSILNMYEIFAILIIN
jgi:hypothetical protein